MSDVTLTAAMRNNLAQLRTTTMLMDMTQNRIATGNKVNSALDDPTAFFKSKGLKDDANDLAVLKDDMGQTISAIQAADKAITSITSLVEQAKSLANSAKSETSATERASLAAQFDDIRSQIDTLAADASYGGQNLITGRGTITGGTFLDTTSTAEAALGGVATGGISRVGTDTNIGTYSLSVSQKVNSLNTVKTGTGTLAGGVLGTAALAGDSLKFFINGVSVGTATTANVTSATSAAAYAAVINALSSDITATISSNKLSITVAEGKTMEIREGAATTSGALLSDLGLSAGLQNDTTGAQVKDLTSDLGVYGAEVYAHVSGYTDNTNTSVTFSVSGTTLTVTDGTGSSATLDTSVFSAAGTDTLAVGDLTVNFVTTLSTENVNVAPTVAANSSAVAQVSTVTFGVVSTTYESGDEITAVVNGNTYAYALTAAAATATAASAAWYAAMKTTIEAAENVTVTNTNNTLVFTSDTAGDAFTIAVSQSVDVGGDTEGVSVATGTANVVQSSTVSITGSIDDGDIYTTTINGTAISYTATSTDTTVTSIAAGLTAAINANTTLVNGSSGVIATATSSAGVITIAENAAGTTLTITAGASDAAISLGNNSSTSSTQTLKSLTTGTATGDMRVTVTSGGASTTTDVNTSSTTAATISNSSWGSTFTFTADDATMVAGESTTISVTNPTGIGENDAQVVFNTDGTSTINVEAVDSTSSGLSISASTGSWATNSNVDAAIAELDAAKTTLRSQSKTMATSLGVIQTRETFTENFIDNLRVGADKLTLADGSEEATNMLMLQTRQQLGIQALSMASQSSQSILVLFR